MNELLLDSKANYLNNIGIVYKVPTRVEAWSLGRNSYKYLYNRPLDSAFNKQITITDVFKGETSDYRTGLKFAIDYADQAQTQLESIFHRL